MRTANRVAGVPGLFDSGFPTGDAQKNIPGGLPSARQKIPLSAVDRARNSPAALPKYQRPGTGVGRIAGDHGGDQSAGDYFGKLLGEARTMKQTTFNFKAQFAPLVESGAKVSTIRKFERTAPPVKKDTLKLFTGMRTKQCRKLREVTCSGVFKIAIREGSIQLGPRLLDAKEEGKIAVADGFTDAAAMRDFFRKTYGLPTYGWWVTWA
jgi:hypothetical protein